MPKLRENIEKRLSPELMIDEEFASLIPPLTPDEFSGLEQSILAEGCREPIITWNGIIVDGHNRYRICREHNIPFRKEPRIFASRGEVMLWMLRNQLSRRNLNDFQRIEMVRKCEEAVKTQAKQRQRGGQGGILLREKLPEVNSGERATDELGAMAGVSRKTYEHASAVLDNAPLPVVDATCKKEISINAAYEVTRMNSEKQSEISERICKGENPGKVISEVKKQKDGLNYWHNLIKHAEKAAKNGQNIDVIISLINEALEILKNVTRNK